MREIQVQVAKKPTQKELDEWYQKNDLTPDKDGIFTSMPYSDAPVERSVILEQVEANSLRRDVPNLHPREYTPKTMVYVAGGPSLSHFLDDVKRKCEDDNYDVYTSNKTCAYLLAHGIRPNFHLILDPTQKKVKDLSYEEDIELVLGLQCHPDLFKRAKEKGVKVSKFLAASITNEDGRTDRDAAKGACHSGDTMLMGIGGGSMCGTRMIYFAAARGYRRLEYYGFDGSIEMGENNLVKCYSYFKPRGENIIETTASNGRTFFSTITLARQGEELVQLLDILPGMDVEIYGDSLLSNQLSIYRELKKPADYRITPEYLDMQRSYHASGSRYGVVGSQSAPRVFMAAAQLHKKLGHCSILDYGCGAGTLKEAMDKHFPSIPGMSLFEYDPAIPGKDGEPAPADMLFCGDVMEHIEPECVHAVICHIASLTKTLALVSICLEPAHKKLPDGRNAHICLKSEEWWLSHFRRRFIISEKYMEGNNIILVCTKFPQ